MARRIEAGGPYYDLVCGQGRVEAFKALGQEEVPALVVNANPLVASLVENWRADLTTTQRYINVRDEMMRAAVDLL